MKLAIVAAVKAFVNQTKENAFELAKKACEKAGYVVKPREPEVVNNEDK